MGAIVHTLEDSSNDAVHCYIDYVGKVWLLFWKASFKSSSFLACTEN